MRNHLELIKENPFNRRAALLQQHIPHLDLKRTTEYLSKIDPNHVITLKQGNFSSIAFDVVFSPGIIPKLRQPEYRRAYEDYFREIYGLTVFDPHTEEFIYPNETDFYADPRTGPNDQQFFSEWIANFRAVALMKQLLGAEANIASIFANNVIEAGLCRMAENGERWPDNLLHAMPIGMQERLDRIRHQIVKELKAGHVLAPGQFFRIANELEFHQDEFMRGNVHDRVSMIMEAFDETSQDDRFSALPPAPVSVIAAQIGELKLHFQPGVDWQRATDRQARQINLQAYLPDEIAAHRYTNIMLGLTSHGSVPPLRKDQQ